MNIPFSAINITEEVNKTGIWKQVNEHNVTQEKEKVKKSPKTSRYKIKFNKNHIYTSMETISRFRKKKHSKKEEKQREERGKLEKRLSTMAEEEEDEGITIKVTDTSLHI